MFPAQRLQSARELTVASQSQVGSGPGFDRHQGQLVQMRPFGIKKARIGELGQRLTAPQAEGLAQRGRRRRQLAVSGQPLSLRDQLLEADDVDLAGSGGQGIAGFGGKDRRRAEGTAQLADLCLQGIGGVRRLPVAPQQVDQPVGANRLTPLQRQQGQQGPLLGAADRHQHATIQRFELAEQPDLHDIHRTAHARNNSPRRPICRESPRLSATTVPPQAPNAGLCPTGAMDMASECTEKETGRKPWNRATPYRCKRAWMSR